MASDAVDRASMPVTITRELLDRLLDKLGQVEILAGEVSELKVSVDITNEATRRKINWTRAIAGLDLTLTIAFGYLIHRDNVLRTQVLCPLYQIFVNSYNPDSLAAKAQGIDTYNRNFALIRAQYDVLGCVPPPK